jgi:hypothetical protein
VLCARRITGHSMRISSPLTPNLLRSRADKATREAL